MSKLRFLPVLLSLLTAVACGSGSSPTGPTGSEPAPTAATPTPTPSGSATITGALSSGSAAVQALAGGASTRAVTVQTVQVVGASASAPVDATGRFTLTNVPAGSIQLRFSGLGADATLPVGSVQAGETISLVVAVNGSLAAILTDSRNPNAVQIPINGDIDTVTGTAAAFQFKIGSRVIRGDTLTVFFGDGDRPDSFDSLREGTRVEVKSLQRDGYFYAFRIHVNGSQGPTPTPNPNPNPNPPQDTSASVEGTLTALGGAAPNLQLVVAGTTVRTNSDTVVQRRGDRQDLSTLRTGMTLHVVGDRQSNGSIDARFIQIKDDETGGAVEIEGSLGGLKGACPAISFGVNGYSVVATGATTFTTPCADLKSGTKVRVRGTRLANGDVQATEISRQ
jgi:hypothetical protein